jgi:hypothetical protein
MEVFRFFLRCVTNASDVTRMSQIRKSLCVTSGVKCVISEMYVPFRNTFRQKDNQIGDGPS